MGLISMDINQLECAILRLGEMLGEYEKMDGLDRLLQEAVKESLIQRFEYTCEVSWKAVKRYLTEYQGYQDAMGPKPVIRLGGQFGILDADKWMEFHAARSATSHDYSEDKAKVTAEIIQNFYGEAVKLCEILKNRIYESKQENK